MANDKELNPSPKFPEGTYPELSPNPKFENGLVNKTNEKPNGSETPTRAGPKKDLTQPEVEAMIKAVTDHKADLVGGKVPASQLPSYVDDVIEGYYYNDKFYEDSEHTEEIAGEKGKIYVDLATANTYRWSGTIFVQVSSGKPMYVHSIYLVAGRAEENIQAGFLIFNNSPTQFTKSTFFDWVKSLRDEVGDRVNVISTGSKQYQGTSYPLSRATMPVGEDAIYFTSLGAPSVGYLKTAFETAVTTFVDGVNKIN